MDRLGSTSSVPDFNRVGSAGQSGQAPKTEAPKSKGFLGSVMAFFKFASKETSQQQTAQKTSWMQSIKEFFFGTGSSTSTDLKGAKPNWGDKSNATLADLNRAIGASTSQPSSGSVRTKGLTQNSSSPNAPQNKANKALDSKLNAVNTNDETALERGSTRKTNQQPVAAKQAKPAAQNKPLSASVSQAGEALGERGEKLNQVNDKAAKLNNTAGDFANMGKQLLEQQKAKASKWWPF